MVRLGLLLLMLAYAAVPPGFCLCRLTALVSPVAAPACPDHDDDDDCDCPRIQHDCLAHSDCAMHAGELPVAFFADAASSGPSTTSAPALAQSERTPSTPLFLTLRALLL